MERENIIKALECCASPEGRCDECPIDQRHKDDCECGRFLVQNALARIKELIEENERLTTYLDEHFPKCIYQYDGEVQEYCVLAPCGQFKTIAEFQKQIESDTVRKMQERLKAKSFRDVPVFGKPYSCVDFAIIDQIAKEMLEV